jgi:hypothetical protein
MNNSEILTKVFDDKNIYFDTINNSLYLNASKTAKEFNKDLSNWRRSKETIAYIRSLSRYVKITERDLMVVKQGGIPEEQGTWIHQKLVILFARWIDVDFAVWCDLTIEEILQTGSYSLSELPNFSEILSANEEALKVVELFKSSSSFDLLLLQKLLKEKSISSLFQLDFSNSYFLPTEIGKLHGLSGRETNLLLEKRGFQEKQDGIWKLTESGKEFGIEFGGKFSQLKWKLETLFRN